MWKDTFACDSDNGDFWYPPRSSARVHATIYSSEISSDKERRFVVGYFVLKSLAYAFWFLYILGGLELWLCSLSYLGISACSFEVSLRLFKLWCICPNHCLVGQFFYFGYCCFHPWWTHGSIGQLWVCRPYPSHAPPRRPLPPPRPRRATPGPPHPARPAAGLIDICSNEGDWVLDLFSGSSRFCHMELNFNMFFFLINMSLY